MKSRLLYHKFLQQQGFKDIIDPPYSHWNSKILTFFFVALLLFLIFIFNVVKKIAVGVIEESPKSEINKLLANQNAKNARLEDPDDEDFEQENQNIRDEEKKGIIQSGKEMMEPLLKFANSAPNPCPRLD